MISVTTFYRKLKLKLHHVIMASEWLHCCIYKYIYKMLLWIITYYKQLFCQHSNLTVKMIWCVTLLFFIIYCNSIGFFDIRPHQRKHIFSIFYLYKCIIIIGSLSTVHLKSRLVIQLRKWLVQTYKTDFRLIIVMKSKL